MLKKILLLAAIVCMGGAAKADAIPQPGDFYLISRDRSGIFVGSHKLFLDYSRGLKQVAYCQRDYFVRGHSVAWTQIETERGNTVRIEYNFGRGWRPICDNPERQVTLEDIGITDTPRDVLASEDESEKARGRLSAIGAMFQPDDRGNGHSTYHTR
ncbi:hypothetical protein [Roseibium sediminicola]|uniref:Uncharacterized protein n=1 Tax=Roseibium sediminicola TaxID=2933272 RepID=A0ABT0GPX1_9HYPH|nr:hypothetical protein [Roseibium sp. CAU 1639]MCK7611474.1 hypothetical protein [Roseibium sp. CAU 1639]